MSKELTPEQRTFIDRFITGKNWIEKADIINAYLDYQRRHDKVAAMLAKLEPGHKELATLREQLANAERKAKDGNFKAAYDDLLSIKNAARGVAKGYIAGLSPGQLAEESAQAAP
jgi:hypothetical protein